MANIVKNVVKLLKVKSCFHLTVFSRQEKKIFLHICNG